MNINERTVAGRKKVVNDNINPLPKLPEPEVKYSAIIDVPVLFFVIGYYLKNQLTTVIVTLK